MAKQKQKQEKVYIASVNWASLLFGIVLTVLAIYAYSFMLGDITIGAISLNSFDVNEFLEYFENEQFYVIPQLMIVAVLAVFQLIAMINVIRLFFGTFFFLGKKDSRKMAQKLAKHARIAFAVMATAIGVLTIASMDNGILPEGITTLYVVSGITVGVFYLLVRYYRWFVVDKKPVTEWVFPLVRDLVFFALPAVLLAMFVTATPIGTALKSFELLVSGVSTSGLAYSAAIEGLCFGIFETVLAFLAFSAVKAAMKFLPFDNYKKSAAKKISGKILGMLIFSIIMVAAVAISVSAIANGGINTDAIIEQVLLNKDILIQLLLLTVGSKVLGSVAAKHDYDDVALAVKPTAAPVAAAAEAPVEAPVEEAAEEAPAVEETSENGEA